VSLEFAFLPDSSAKCALTARVIQDQHDAIDLTDNSIVTLGNLPLLKRLNTLLLANNKVSHISPSIHISVPNLTTLVLTNNQFAELGDLEPLKELRYLKYVSLMGNPVREKKWYREWLAWRLPGLRVLDFQRIRDKVRSHKPSCSNGFLNCKPGPLQERQAGKALFVTAENLPTALATTLSTTVSTQSSKAVITTDEPKMTPLMGKAGRLMSKEDAEKVKAAIAKATSMEEVRRLERSLREGYMPEMESVGA
jgi:U2 small nuclear ribonucleoprotein A'